MCQTDKPNYLDRARTRIRSEDHKHIVTLGHSSQGTKESHIEHLLASSIVLRKEHRRTFALTLQSAVSMSLWRHECALSLCCQCCAHHKEEMSAFAFFGSYCTNFIRSFRLDSEAGPASSCTGHYICSLGPISGSCMLPVSWSLPWCCLTSS